MRCVISISSPLVAKRKPLGEYLSMGSQALVEGRLNWRQWEAQDGQVRGKYDVVANTVQFLSRAQQPEPRDEPLESR